MTESVKETGKKRKVGDGTPGPGRPKGVPNKSTAGFKAAVAEAFEGLGGVDALVNWAQENPGDFYTKVWTKLAPAEIKAELSSKNGQPLVVVRDLTGRKPS